MKKIMFLTFSLLGIATGVNCQKIIPSTATLINDKEQMKIVYDLNLVVDVLSYDIQVKITSRGRTINASQLSGDFGSGVIPGAGKNIIWDAISDGYDLDSSYEATITVTYHKKPCLRINPLPAYLGLAGTTIVGTGLIVAGLNYDSEADDYYYVYKNNLYSKEAAFYGDLSRQGHYDKANELHKKSQWFIWGGAAVIATGGTFAIYKLVKIKRHNEDCLNDLGSNWRLEPYIIPGQGNAAGLAITYRF